MAAQYVDTRGSDVARPTMRFVQIKSEAAKASAVVFRARDLLVRQRTQIINALRNHLDWS
jgi:transposase